MQSIKEKKHRVSKLTPRLQQSGIRSVSQRCMQIQGINLGQGICDIPTPIQIKKAAAQAIDTNKNTYSSCEGVFELRTLLSEKLFSFNQIKSNPEDEIIITHGSTGAFVCATQIICNPGDEVILFEPFYGYHKNILEIFGVIVKPVAINMQDFSINMQELEAAINEKTKAIVICTPCNPCGKVFSKTELLQISDLVKKHDLYVITDEIYEYITYPGFEHISFGSLADNAQRTITISGFSKTFNITGWRLGYACGPKEILQKMALLHDLIYVCPPTPLQYAMVEALKLSEDYYQDLQKAFLDKRDLVCEHLQEMGFQFSIPQGAYYIMADISNLNFHDDEAAVTQLLEQAKVAVVPGRSFYSDAHKGKHYLRFCFALNEEKLTQALTQLQKIF